MQNFQHRMAIISFFLFDYIQMHWCCATYINEPEKIKIGRLIYALRDILYKYEISITLKIQNFLIKN